MELGYRGTEPLSGDSLKETTASAPFDGGIAEASCNSLKNSLLEKGAKQARHNMSILW